MLADTLAAYQARMAAETPGTDLGQVSPTALDAVAQLIADAQATIDSGQLNINLAHTYIYYLQRAWQAVEQSRITTDYSATGNYRLFWTPAESSLTASDPTFSQNDDQPWGYYAYNVEAGTYQRFTTYDNRGKCGSATERGLAWYRANEYCFVSSTGHFHPCTTGVSVTVSSPAIVFTAPADGIYYATLTVRRNVANQQNTLYLRSRYLGQGQMQAPKSQYLFEQAYGTPAVDGSDGRTPQTLDFYINLRQGDRFTLETEAYTSGSDASGRTIITDLSVTSCHSTDQPYTQAEAQAHPRYYDAMADALTDIPAQADPAPAIYDLSGRRVTSHFKNGLYIIGNKKILVR